VVVPGFGGLAVDIERVPAERFAHGFHDWAQPRLTAREMAMLRLMNRLTDIPHWEDLVLDDAAWEWWVAELRNKGRAVQADWASCRL
jgi:hypothetical protein